MSVSPAQNFSNPPPVPDWPTVICTFGCSSLKSSAAAWANGKTVDEPSIRIEPDSSSEDDSSPEAAPAAVPLVVVPARGDDKRQRRHHGEHQQQTFDSH